MPLLPDPRRLCRAGRASGLPATAAPPPRVAAHDRGQSLRDRPPVPAGEYVWGAVMDIVSAMNDPLLLGQAFPGRSWDGWRAILLAAFALPMTDEQRAFLRAVADRDPPRRRVRELWVIAGRRAGKDSIASVIAAHAAAMFDGRGALRPGERALVQCLACDRDQSRIVLGYTRAFFDNPMLRRMVTRDTADGLELENGVDIVVATNNFRTARGRTVLCAIFDEVAFWRSEVSSSPDEETYRAIRPGLSTLSEAMLVGISSPYRKSGLLYSKFKKHFGHDDDDVLVIRAPTAALNPTISPAVIAAALEDDPAAAKSEWMGEFRDDIGGWADAAVIEAAVDSGVTVRPPRADFGYVSFCDPSGGARDSFTMAVAHTEGNIVVLDCLVEVRAPFNPSAATEQIASVLRSYGLQRTTGDRYSAQWVVEAFAKCGITYEHSERDRSALYLDCLPLFTSGRARLLDSKRLVTQFASLERRTSPIGKDRVDHGPGGADDLCNSAAGALVAAAGDMDGLGVWRRLAGDMQITPPAAPEPTEVAVHDPVTGLVRYLPAGSLRPAHEETADVG
jgi:hypothetical protein